MRNGKLRMTFAGPVAMSDQLLISQGGQVLAAAALVILNCLAIAAAVIGLRVFSK